MDKTAKTSQQNQKRLHGVYYSMVQQLMVYEAADGSLHRTLLDALKADLIITVLGFKVLNEASTKQLVDEIMGDIQNVKDIHATLTALLDIANEAMCSTPVAEDA